MSWNSWARSNWPQCRKAIEEKFNPAPSLTARVTEVLRASLPKMVQNGISAANSSRIEQPNPSGEKGPMAAIAGDKRKAAISIAAIFVGGKRSAGVSVGDLKDVGTRKVAKVVAPADAEIGPLLEKVSKRAPAPVVKKGAGKHAAPAPAEICSLEPVHKPSPAALKAGLLDVPAPAVETIVNAVLVHQSSPAPAAEKVGAVSETPCHNTFERVPRQGYLVGLFQTPGGCFCAGHDPKPRPRRTVTDLVAEYNGLEKTVAEVRIGIDKRTKGSMFSVFLAEEADTTLVPWDEEADGTIVEAEARVSKQQFEGTDDYCVGRVRFTGQFRSGNPVLKASLNSSNSTARSVEGFANAPCYYEGGLRYVNPAPVWRTGILLHRV